MTPFASPRSTRLPVPGAGGRTSRRSRHPLDSAPTGATLHPLATDQRPALDG